MSNNAEIHLLLLTADRSLVATVADVSREIGMEAHASGDAREISDQLNQTKYEGVILDFDTVSNARPVFASLRESRSHKNAIVFAVATDNKYMEQALKDGAHFLLRRPFENTLIRRTLHAAYDLMLGEQ